MIQNAANDDDEINAIAIRDISDFTILRIAEYLIDKYINTYWKNDKKDYNYTTKRLFIMSDLRAICTIPYSSFVEILADGLKIHSMELYNDPNLCFDVKNAKDLSLNDSSREYKGIIDTGRI